MDYEIACTGGGTPTSKRRHGRRVLERLGADSESSALVTAVEENDLDTVEQLLGSGVDLGVLDPAGNTVLHTAARRGHADLCAVLVRHGADVNAQNKALFSPLFLAARVDLLTVCLLLDLGADVRLRNHLGEIPLHAAASSGLNDVMVTLISYGSDVNARSVRGVTPLYCAVGSGSRQAVKTLLSAGAEVNSVVTPELALAGGVRPSERPRAWKEGANSNGSEHPYNVPVCVPRPTQQQQFHDRLATAGLHRHGPGPDEAGRPNGRQCGPADAGGQQQDQRSDQAVRATHPHHPHHPCRAWPSTPLPLCQTLPLHPHRLDQRESPRPSVPAHPVPNASGDDIAKRVAESCSEDVRIPQPLPPTPPSSRDDVTHSEVAVHTSLGPTATRNPVHLQFSTCRVQRSTGETGTQNPMRKTIPLCPASDKKHTPPSDAHKSSAAVMQSQQADHQVAAPAGVRLHPHTPDTAEKSSIPSQPAGLTALHRACQLGMETVAQVLLEAGACLQARTERGETPLHMAALYSSTTGHGEVTGLLRLLLKAGADVEAVTWAGSTPLHLAAMVGDALCTSLLITARADLHKQDGQGNGPLHKACERIVSPEANRVRTIRLLLTNGASARAVNHLGLTPLHVLLLHKTDDMDHDVLRELLNHHADPNQAPPSGEAPLLLALRHGMYGFAKVLVEKGADPNIQDDEGKTPLHYVCNDGQLQLFKLLWSKGGNPAKPDHEGFTPLRYALESGEELMVGACISSGASAWQPSTASVAASSVTELFSNPASCLSPFQYAFASAQPSVLSTLYHSSCFSFSELHGLRQLCAVVSLPELTRAQREVVSFVLAVSHSPASLQNQSRWAISRWIGCCADRKWRARELGLPTLLRDFVLFVKGS